MTDQKKPNKFATVISTVICCGLIAGGCFLMVTGVFAVFTAWVGTSWPTAKAIIIESKIEDRSSDDATWGSTISYRFQADGKQFIGNRVYPGDRKTSAHRLWIIRNSPVESTKTVHYRPSNPSTAYLEVGVYRYMLFGVVMGLLLISFGAVFFVVNYLGRKSSVPFIDGEQTFPLNHPISKVIMGSFVLIAAEFALLFYCVR